MADDDIWLANAYDNNTELSFMLQCEITHCNIGSKTHAKMVWIAHNNERMNESRRLSWPGWRVTYLDSILYCIKIYTSHRT